MTRHIFYLGTELSIREREQVASLMFAADATAELRHTHGDELTAITSALDFPAFQRACRSVVRRTA